MGRPQRRSVEVPGRLGSHSFTHVFTHSLVPWETVVATCWGSYLSSVTDQLCGLDLPPIN